MKIQIGVSGGAHVDFCKWVNKIKQINETYHFGYDFALKSLGDFEVGNWSELVAKCNILLPIAKQIRNKLEPPPKVVRARPFSI